MNESIVIGKRIPIGSVVGSLVALAVSFWNARNPDSPMSAGDATALATAAIGVTQLIVVNFFGVTTK